MCTLDFMDYWLKTIYAHTSDNTNGSVHNTRLSPPVFIVGTHRNSLASDPEIQEMLVWHPFYLVGGGGLTEWSRSLTFDYKVKITDVGLPPDIHLKCYGFHTPTNGRSFTDWFVITVIFLFIWDSVGLMINYHWKLIDLRYP